jgi:hypothetical protein
MKPYQSCKSTITQGLRTYKVQEDLYAQEGQNPEKSHQCQTAESIYNYGLAADI